jgi:uncharacterized protein YndB with AHSA1/START domain
MARQILLGVDVHADQKAVFDAITTKDGLASFWTTDAVAEPEVGSEARFGFEGAPMPLRMRVDRLEPGSEVVWTCLGDFPYWLNTTVTWSLSKEPEHGGTRLLFRHAGFPDEQPEWETATVAYSWAGILARLKGFAETGKPQPYFS